MVQESRREGVGRSVKRKGPSGWSGEGGSEIASSMLARNNTNAWLHVCIYVYTTLLYARVCISNAACICMEISIWHTNTGTQ